MAIPLTILKAIAKNPMRSIGFGAGAYSAVTDFEDSIQSGNSVPSALLTAGASAIVYSNLVTGTLATVGTLGSAAYDFYQNESMDLRQQTQNGQVPFLNTNFQDTQQYATMRQAGMAIAKKSDYTLQQSLLGNEAKFLHRE